MNRNPHVNLSPRQKRLALVSAVVLVSLAMIASACSTDATTEAPTPTSTPVAIAVAPAQGSESATTEATTHESVTTAPAAAADLDLFFDEVETSGFDGVIAIRNGSDISTRAYGTADRENDVMVDAETVFDIASISKQFTGAAILRLEMDGRLSVDDTLGEHVPGLPADKAAITLHQLLTHTAGLPGVLGPDDEPIERSDFLNLVSEAPLIREPGERYEYSNPGYALLAAVIEFETGEPYEQYLRTALFEPAGMLDTGYVLPDWDDHTIAVGYSEPSGERFGRPNERVWDVDGPYWHLRGNGGLLSTAADMLRWDVALIGNDVLDEEAKAKFFAPHVPGGPSGDFRYGYGWQIVPTPMGTPLITHNGGNLVFFADFLRFVDQETTVFVATNTYQSDGYDDDLSFEVANRLLNGALSAMGQGDDEAAAGHCGFEGLTISSLPDYPEIETLPDSPAGRTTTTLLDLLVAGDAEARLDFATQNVTEEFAGDDPTVLAEGIVGLQETLAGYEVVQILKQDELRLHLRMQGPGVDLLVSAGFDEADPQRIACMSIAT